MKQNSWTTRCTQNEAESARETLIWVESVTEKETGNAQPGACVDVLPRCWLSITWLYDCLSTPIKIWNVPVTVPRNNAVLFMKWHTQTISKSLNNSNKLLPEKTTDIIKWCHGCRFPCEKMSEEQVLKFHTLMTCHYPDLGNCTSSVWNFCRVILQTSFCRETCNRGIA